MRLRCGNGGSQVELEGADGSLVLKVSAVFMGRQCGSGGYWWGDGGKVCGEKNSENWFHREV